MINPVHRMKKFVRYVGNEKPACSYVTNHSGWLGSGVTDCNGVEIYEGDRVRFGDRDYPVEFRNGALTVDGAPLVMYGNGDDLEVVGHITEAPNDNRI